MTGNELKDFIRAHATEDEPVMLDKAGKATWKEQEAVYEVTVYRGTFCARIKDEYRTSGMSGCTGMPAQVLSFIACRVLYGEVDNS